MRITRICFRRAAQMVDYYSQFHPSVLSIQSFIDFGSTNADEKKSFLFMRKELPVRLANIMKEIHLLPTQLLSMPSLQLMEGWYEQSFHDILEYERSDPEDMKTRENFADTLDEIRNRHAHVVETTAQGVVEMKETHEDCVNIDSQIQYFLDRFYINRISIRMLIHQHLLLFGTSLSNHPRHIGCIDPLCDVLAVAEDAFDNAKFLCEQYYLAAPECNFVAVNPYERASKAAMTYVPSHLYHMLFELFKNSLRAVVEYHGELNNNLPKLDVMICKGKEDLTIKISDQGGGISRSEIDLMFNYMYSTAPRPPSPQAASTTPLAGYGYGLPLSRLYAKYFNGDLRLNSVEGYGTDATIYLKVFPEDASELLPVYNKTSTQVYTANIPVGDWSDPNQTAGLHGGHQFNQHRMYNVHRQSRYRPSHSKTVAGIKM